VSGDGQPVKRLFVVVFAALISFGVRGAAQAAPDPAAERVEALCNGVLEAVKQAKGATLAARARALQPVVEKGFDLEVMAQFAIGEPWTKMTAKDQAAVVSALTRYTSARYAQEFDAFTGQRCTVDAGVTTRGPDKLVKSQIVDAGGATAVNYRLRAFGGEWRVIDVFYKGVSQLATQRADFASVVQSGGAPGLVSKLNELTAKTR
jgi:phospholipid transport system substrate-binding protein